MSRQGLRSGGTSVFETDVRDLSSFWRAKNLNERDSSLFSRHFMKRLVEALAASGFKEIDGRAIEKEAVRQGLWPKGVPLNIVRPYEKIFNLGLGSSRSNFFIFAIEREGRVEVAYTNPVEGRFGLSLSFDEHSVKKTFSDGAGDAELEHFVKSILACAKEKLPDVYRMMMHVHWGYINRGDWFEDDGVSHFRSVLHRAMLHHVDVLASSPHNSFEKKKYALIELICREVGIVAPPGTELTMPLTDESPNGPHRVIVMANEVIAEHVRRKILSRRDPNLHMQSYFLGMTRDEMMKELKPLAEKGYLFIGEGHPVNHNSPSIKIYSVGALTVVEKGLLSLQEALAMIREDCTTVAAWNPSVSSEPMHLGNPELLDYLYAILNKHNLGHTLTANACNLALSKEFEEQGKGSHFDVDEHRAIPFDYNLGGDAFGKGHTNLVLTGALWDALQTPGGGSRKPSTVEIVSWIAKGLVKPSAFVYCTGSDPPVISPNREVMSQVSAHLERQMADEQMQRYILAIGHDAFYLFSSGQHRQMKNMS